ALTGTAAQERALNIGAGWDSVLVVNGTEVINGSGSVVSGQILPAGNDTEIQFNDSGSLAGDSGLTYNKTTDALTVSGSAIIDTMTIDTASITDSTGAIDFGNEILTTTGNVGIGTTSPAQKLHVEGQCVTGDTLLAILPDLSLLHSAARNDMVRYVPIKDVQPGMMAYSLNEELGIIEPHRINGLLDMGVKPVFRLTTEDGRTIRTTGNHPYLTKEGWRKVIELSAGEEIAVPNEINGHASYGVHDNDQSTLLSTQSQGLLKAQTASSYVITSFSGINKETSNYRDNTNKTQGKPCSWRELFKEITRQPNSKYGYPHCINGLGNKFSASIVYNIHQYIIYHTARGLSMLLYSKDVYADAGFPLPEHLTETYEFSDTKVIWLNYSKPALDKDEDGRTIRTTGNHPYLTKEGWRKVIELSVGEEIAAPKDEVCSSVDFSAVANPGNQDAIAFPIKHNSIITDLESIRGEGVTGQTFGKIQRIGTHQVEFQLFDNPASDIFGKFKKFSFSKIGKIITNHLRPAFFLTALPGTLPDLRDALSEARKSGLVASISSSSSSRVCLSNTNASVLPFLSTTRTIPSNGNSDLNALGDSKKTIFSSANPFNRDITIFSPPFYNFWQQVYHSLDNLSSKAYATLAPPLPAHLTEQYEFSDTKVIWLNYSKPVRLRRTGLEYKKQ
ncbi:MAG: hypothetical protein KKG01_06525, partial [Candidatus Omnitrophica bacterium]|nr:hypothetical protein [Candidatus Omnitrophota bacterium]